MKKRLLFTLIVLMFEAAPFFACTVCFGNPEDPVTKGLMASIGLLLGVVGFVLASILWTAYSWHRRSKRLS